MKKATLKRVASQHLKPTNYEFKLIHKKFRHLRLKDSV
jgi:hypothetical protein